MTNEPEWWQRFDKEFDKVLKDDGIAVHFDDRKRIGLYYTATTIGMAKSRIKSFIKEEKEKSLRDGMKASCENCYSEGVRVGNIELEDSRKQDKSELLSKIEEEVEGLADETGPASVRMSAYKDVLELLSKYKTL